MTFPRLLSALGSVGAFGFYAGLNVIAFVMIFLLVPGKYSTEKCFLRRIDINIAFIETKQRTLEELDDVFSVTISRHMSYQVREFLPYWVRRYPLRQKVELKALYNFDEVDARMG